MDIIDTIEYEVVSAFGHLNKGDGIGSSDITEVVRNVIMTENGVDIFDTPDTIDSKYIHTIRMMVHTVTTNFLNEVA